MNKFILITAVVFLLTCLPAKSQNLNLRILPHPEEVYIYHTKRLPAGYGFKVYRQDTPDGDFRLITETPVSRARSSGELQSRLGSSFVEIKDFFEAENAGELWLFLQSRFLETMIAVSLFPELAEVMGMLYVDRSAPVGREVTYRLEFVDISGNLYDGPLTAKLLLEPYVPDAPSQLRAENDGATVTLYWHYPRVEPEEDDKVIRFFIYRMNPETDRPELLNKEALIRNNAHEEHFFRFISPVTNATEKYFVTAADITGQQSEPSQVLSYEIVDVSAPAVVEKVRVTGTPYNHAEISWTKPVDNDITGYHIYRTNDLSVPFTRINEELIPVDELSYVDVEVKGGMTCFYHVTATNRAGYESEKGALAMTRIKDAMPPPPPENLNAVFDVETGTVSLRWEIEEITPDLKSFIILRRREDQREPGGFSRVNFSDLKETSFIDSGEGGHGFHEGGIYRYVVYSSDHAENYSDTSTLLVGIPLFTPPDPPTGLVAVNDRGFRINLNWNASSSVTISEYIIHRGDPDDMALVELARVSSKERFYRDEKVETGHEYVYAVTAVDREDNESQFSNVDTLFFRSTTPPRSVRNVQAIERDEGVYLVWEPVPGNDLVGYRVYRAGIATGIYEPVHEELLTAAEFFDSSGKAGQWYRVRAVDGSGNESARGRAVRPVVPGDE